MKEFIEKVWPQIWEYRGRVLGSLVGFIAGLLWAFLGFWKALVFIVCIVIGYFLGKRIDQRGSLRDIFNKVFPPNE